MFLPHIDVFFDLLLYRPTATWNLFTSYNNKITYVCNDDVIFTSIIQYIKSNQNACIIQLTMVKSMKALYYTHEVINIASAGEKEVHFLIISHSHNEDSILSESKIFQLSLFDLNTRGTMLGTENDTWHSKRFFPSTNVTFDEPCQNNHVSFDQCYQGLPREYPAGVQASSSLLRWSSTVPRDHLYLECLLLKFSLRVLKGMS